MVEVVRTRKCNWIGVFDYSGGRFWCELGGRITSAMFGNGTRPMGGVGSDGGVGTSVGSTSLHGWQQAS